MKNRSDKILKQIFAITLTIIVSFCCSCSNGIINSKEAYALQIQKEDALDYVYNTFTERVSQRYVDNSEFEALGLTGDYKGNAVEFTERQSAYTNNNYYVKLKINQEEYEKIKKEGDYTKMYVWLCVVYTGEETIWLTLPKSNKEESLIQNGKQLRKDKEGIWFQHKIELNAKQKEKMFDKEGNAKTLHLFATYFSKTEQGNKYNLYVGDIGFCN